MPNAETFVDLFFGGGAITHCALLSGKYEHFIANDINERLPELFLECVNGKHTTKTHPEWISREDFFRLSNDDIYVALIWSFGNNMKDYIYGADIEDFKHAYHDAVFRDEPARLRPFGYDVLSSHKADVYDRYIEFNQQIARQAGTSKQLEHMTRQIEIERLQSLQGLQSLQEDYKYVDIPEGALIYCDPPYQGTNCGNYAGFDSVEFHEWAREQDNIYISEYSMPDDFIEIANIQKTVLSAANGNSAKVTERLYTNRKTYDKMQKEQKALIAGNLAVQMSILQFA